MARYDETTFLAAGHVETELVFRRQSEELKSQASHLGDELRVDAVIHHLENPPVLTRRHYLPANLGPVAAIDSGEWDHRDVVAELIVARLGPLVFISNEFWVDGIVLGQWS